MATLHRRERRAAGRAAPASRRRQERRLGDDLPGHKLGRACEPIANYLARNSQLEAAAVLAGSFGYEPLGPLAQRLRHETIALISTLTDRDELLARGKALTPAQIVELALRYLPAASPV